MKTYYSNLVLLILTLAGFLPLENSFAAEFVSLSSVPPIEQAAVRIEQHRKSNGTVIVVDADGKPIPGVEVAILQTRHEFLFGCNFFQFGRLSDQKDEDAYRDQFKDLFNYATLAFYWSSYERRQGNPRHAYTQEVAKWCHEHGITCKGHPLAWNYSDPAWLPDEPDAIRRLQLRRITDCVSRFRGLIDIWDVVNEATDFQRKAFQERAPKMTRMWARTGRIELVTQCFKAAREANRDATLLINDYRTDPTYVRVIQQLTEQVGKQPFDVIGIQSHMHGGTWPNAKIWEVCERFAQFQVPLHFTEMTILSGQSGGQRARGNKSWPSTPAGEQRQADEVERVYTMLFSHPRVTGITWWDFADRNAWQKAPAGLLRKDLSPKPAYQRLHDLVKHRWWTRTKEQTDAEGRVTFRGFLGDYQVAVRTTSGQQKQTTMTLSNAGNNSARIKLK